jgi:hypothetical protein
VHPQRKALEVIVRVVNNVRQWQIRRFVVAAICTTEWMEQVRHCLSVTRRPSLPEPFIKKKLGRSSLVLRLSDPGPILKKRVVDTFNRGKHALSTTLVENSGHAEILKP